MNGYKMLADSYRQVLEGDGSQGIDKAAVEKKIKVLDFLATCDAEEIQELFNSSAFNDIVRGYFLMAMQNMDLEEEKISQIIQNLKNLFDMVTAGEAEKYYNNH